MLFSHGYSGGGIGSVEITEALAANGWIVAAPDHHDAVMSVRIYGASQGNLISALQLPAGNHFVYNSEPVAWLSGGTARQFEIINDTARAFLERHLLNRATTIQSLETKPGK